MSAQRARSAVETGHRSIHPGIAGVPWWAAVVIAVTASAVGFAFDAGSGNKELTAAFAAMYVLGCVTSVLAVQQSGIFTAVIQPPLILFCSVPGAYFVFHGSALTDVKNLLINCGYPLIERFPLMLFTSAAVLLIGLGRWYVALATRGAANAATAAAGETADRAGWLTALVTKLTARPSRAPTGQDAAPRPRKRPANRSTAADRPTRPRRPRPPVEQTPDPRAEPARRRRPPRTREFDAAQPPPPPRRPRPPREAGPRAGSARENGRRAPQERRTSRYDPHEAMEPHAPAPRRRPPVPTAPNSVDATHHPVSRVRYRESPADERGGAPRPRTPRGPDPDSWG